MTIPDELLAQAKAISSHFGNSLCDLIKKMKSPDPFWGFDAKGSDAPSSDKASAGRINPVGISYLYAAEDAHTAIVETRPAIEQMVSVSEIEVKKDLKLFDFCADLSTEENTDSQATKIFIAIAKHLSIPNYVGDIGYLATQYVSAYIKNMEIGFDGIRFGSSLHKGGVNIVLFDTSKDDNANKPENYVVKNSVVHFVEGITVTEKRVFPVDMEEFYTKEE